MHTIFPILPMHTMHRPILPGTNRCLTQHATWKRRNCKLTKPPNFRVASHQSRYHRMVLGAVAKPDPRLESLPVMGDPPFAYTKGFMQCRETVECNQNGQLQGRQVNAVNGSSAGRFAPKHAPCADTTDSQHDCQKTCSRGKDGKLEHYFCKTHSEYS